MGSSKSGKTVHCRAAAHSRHSGYKTHPLRKPTIPGPQLVPSASGMCCVRQPLWTPSALVHHRRRHCFCRVTTGRGARAGVNIQTRSVCPKPIWAASWLVAEARLTLKTIGNFTNVLNRAMSRSGNIQLRKWASLLCKTFFWRLFVVEFYSRFPTRCNGRTFEWCAWNNCEKVPTFTSLPSIVCTYSFWTNGSKVFTRKKTPES